jgi:hypothetical protein
MTVTELLLNQSQRSAQRSQE